MKFLSNSASSLGANIAVIIVLALLTVGTILALIVFLCKFAESEKENKKRWIVPTILAVGFAVRFIFALCIRGYRGDYGIFTDMFADLDNNGVYGYYKGDPSETLYPVTHAIYLIFGGFANLTGLSEHALGAQFAVKLPLIIADLTVAYFVYRLARKYFNVYVGYALCAFVCVCPIFFIGSAIWATPMVLTAAFMFLACYFTARKKYAVVIATATAAAFSSKEGIYLFPVVLVFCVYHFVRAAINVKNDKPRGKALRASEYNAVYAVPTAFIVSVLVAYLLGLFMFAGYSYNIFTYIYEFLLKPLVGWEYFTFNGLSVYAVFGQNGAEPGARFPAWVFVGIFLAIALGVVCVVYFTKRNRATMVMLAAYVLITLQLYFPGATAVGMTSVFGVLLASYALVKDKRILYVLFTVGIAFVLNSTGVLAYFGHLNNLPAHELGGESSALVGSAAALPIACSVFAFIAHLYFTYVCVSVGMSGQKRMLGTADGIGGSLKEFFAPKRRNG